MAITDQIVGTAVELGERSSWEAVRLHDVAAALGISLDEVSEHFQKKDDIVNAWFERADNTMLKIAQASDLFISGNPPASAPFDHDVAGRLSPLSQDDQADDLWQTGAWAHPDAGCRIDTREPHCRANARSRNTRGDIYPPRVGRFGTCCNLPHGFLLLDE